MRVLARSVPADALARQSLLAVAAMLVAAMLVVACSRVDPPGRPVTAARVSAAEFGRLRWLEGRWRGVDATGGGTPFFESYRFVDDSTIQGFTYRDSTFAEAVDTSLIQLRGDTVVNGWPTPTRVATSLDSASVHFAAGPGAGNDFTWRWVAIGIWQARLTWDSSGVARERVYEMRAVMR
jgi:hypothetical protein